MDLTRKKKIIIIIVALAMILIVALIAAVNFGPMMFMNPSESEEFSNSSIHILKNNINNVFLINSTEGYIIIDTGSNMDTILEELKKFNINESEVKHIFLTHTDYDHVGGLSLFKNAKIYMNEDILQQNGSKKTLNERNSIEDKLNVESVNLISNEELIIGNIKITCIKTPGHTPGHMVYLIDDKYLFTGDAVEITDNSLKIHPFTMDEKKSDESIKIIINVLKNCEYIFTAHYGYYKVQDLNIK